MIKDSQPCVPIIHAHVAPVNHCGDLACVCGHTDLHAWLGWINKITSLFTAGRLSLLGGGKHFICRLSDCDFSHSIRLQRINKEGIIKEIAETLTDNVFSGLLTSLCFAICKQPIAIQEPEPPFCQWWKIVQLKPQNGDFIFFYFIFAPCNVTWEGHWFQIWPPFKKLFY